MISIDTKIPSGNISFNRIDNDGAVHLNLNREFDLFTHCFYFKVRTDKTAPETIRFSIDNASQSNYSNGWNDYAPFISLDGAKWKRISKGGQLIGSSFTFEIDELSDEFYVSWYLPYSFEKYKNWIASISLAASVDVVQGNNVPDYIFLGDKTKPVIAIIARQHPGESMGSFVIEGFISSLINNSQSTKKILKKYSIIIFPLLNMTGVEKGFHRVNENGEDLNRCWDRSDISEIQFVKDTLTSFNSIDSIIDIHGDEVSKLHYIFFNSKNRNQKIFLNSLFASDPKLVVLPEQSFIKSFIKHLLRKGTILKRSGITLLEYGRKQYKANTYTIEVSAMEASETDCHNTGHNLFKAINAGYDA